MVWVIAVPVPVIAPDKVMGLVPATVSAYPPLMPPLKVAAVALVLALVIALAAVKLIVALLEKALDPVMLKVPPPKVIAPVPKLLPTPTDKVPALIVVPPV